MKYIKQAIKDMDKVLLIVTIALFVFGLLNIVTASSKAAVVRYNTSLYNYFYKQLISIFLGIVASFFILKKSTKKYPFWVALFYFVFLLLLIYVKLYVESHNGSQNWIKIPGFGTLQPSEFAKPIMIMAVALLFEKYYKKLRAPNINHYDLIGIILFIGMLYPVIVFLEKDLGTTIILVLIFGSLFLSSPILRIDKFRIISMSFILLFIIGSFLLMKTGSILTKDQLARFNFFNPCSDYYEGGYQICNGFIAINDGGLLGVGIGNSKQVSYIPESHTDSVFAIISEEYGFVICTFIFLGYLLVILRIFKLASRTSSLSGRYICYGIGIYIFLHVIVNLGGLFGIMPLTGVPLPFLSYGGSYTLSLICSLAVVQRIHIETQREKIAV
ncbi:MAG: FtsW/RodA/SpoVE family cell cycle protein [Bacilli bacterium]|nr:FtsW/RodA/SpoVE family cell cycle protein [Bacilli bacterium]